MNTVDLVIVGGGPAGLAAAVSARDAGVENILILERDKELGGILNQCIHNGFGLHTFNEELTGPEYAARYIEQIKDRHIEYMLNTIVLDIASDLTVTAMNSTNGMFCTNPKAVILAMGCRERPRGALNIPGFRPAGIYSAGTAQRLVNMEGFMPGKEIVILGSGDIGLIMARRLTLEGAVVKVVAEIMPYSGGLKRNIVQCLDDYGIPLKLSHTVVNIEGGKRLTGVTIAQVNKKNEPIFGTEEYYSCDTLLLSCGLIPENELSRGAGIELNPVTNGPTVNESLETNVPGVFACGNVLHVHDLVDYVSEEASAAGEAAASYIQKCNDLSYDINEGAIAKEGTEYKENTQSKTVVRLCPEDGIRYTVPSYIRPEDMKERVMVRFRVDNVYKDRYLAVYGGKELLFRRKKKILAPGEMEQIVLSKKDLGFYPESIRIRIEEE